ncbi:hypothetical protein [Peribacillus sp. Bi96]|uniref:hypothetical protein n=1 Tax=Peribacillus sp. Bi96 TaxID=2884273 RepID=UPI001E3A0215|nr:hypothetical protein [Peribacillus sp. Bi96]
MKNRCSEKNPVVATAEINPDGIINCPQRETKSYHLHMWEAKKEFKLIIELKSLARVDRK